MKIYINNIPGTLSNEIFFIQDPGPRAGDIGYFLTFSEKGELLQNNLIRERGAASTAKPAMILDELITRELIEAFSNLAKSRGIEPDSESKAKGKLEATERHLEDMRTLLKLKK